MKITEVLNAILTVISLSGVGVSCVSCVEGHPRPRDEIYELRDPQTNRPVVRFDNTQWTDGRSEDYYGTIKFRQLDGSVFSIFLLSNDPNLWTAQYCKPGAEPEEIGLNRIYGPSIYPRNFFDKCWVEETESFK